LKCLTTAVHQNSSDKEAISSDSDDGQFVLLERPIDSYSFLEAKRVWFSKDKVDDIDKILKDYDNVNEDSNSAYLRGLKYEYDVLKFLKRFGFSLERTGRSGDRGVDFRGVWRLPDLTVPVVGQCKNEKKPVSSRYIREFIGTLHDEKQNAVGVFVSNSHFSKECRLTAAVEVPLLFCQLENDKLVWIYLNVAAQKRIPNLTITAQNDTSGQKAIYLMYFLKKS
jgi:hypothetical protein